MGRLALALLLLTGCGSPRLTEAIQFDPLPRYEAPELAELVATEPAPLLAGDAAPFDGFLFSGDDWRRIKGEIDRLKQALGIMEAQAQDDRWWFRQRDSALIEALKACRQQQPRAFAAGIGVGFGGCGAAVGAIGLSR